MVDPAMPSSSADIAVDDLTEEDGTKAAAEPRRARQRDSFMMIY
jgi:hypothetical protein